VIPKRRYGTASFVSGVLLGMTIGCAAPGVDDAGSIIAHRLISRTPEKLFNVQDLSDARRVREIEFSNTSGKRRWKLKHLKIDPSSEKTPGIDLTVEPGGAEIIISAGFDASRIDVVELSGSLLVGRFTLDWAGPGAEFCADQRVSIETQAMSDHVRFFPAGNPLWSGKIGRIRIGLAGHPEQRCRLAAVRFQRLKINPSRLTSAVEQGWLAALGEDFRPTRLGTEGRSFVWRFDGAEGDRLDFAVGLQPGVRSRTRFEIRTGEESQDERPVIWSLELDPAAGEADRWFEQEILLPAGLSRQVVLEFSVSSADGRSQTRGMPLWGAPVVVRRAQTPEGAGDFNVLLISIDTLRSDHVSAYGYPRKTTPNLDRWVSGRGVLFENTVASAPWTLPSHYSMLSGLDAIHHGINHGPPMNTVRLMAEIFSERGFATAARTGGGFLHPRYGLHRGFDTYRAQYSHGDSEELDRGISGLIDWLETHQDRRFFAFLHTYEVHGPYRARRPFIDQWRIMSDGDDDVTFFPRPVIEPENPGLPKRFMLSVDDRVHPVHAVPDDQIEKAIDYYDAGVAYTDDRIGRLLDYFQEHGLFENTVLVVTSDHGEALGEKGLAGHAYLYDFSIMVPLMISAPELDRPGLRISRQVRLIDLMPTVLDLAGIDIPDGIDGVSLASLMRGEDADIPEFAWTYAPKTNYGMGLRVANEHKYTFNNTAWTPAQGTQEWFRLADDPTESENCADDPEVGIFREDTLEEIRARERGLLIKINNPSSSRLDGELIFSQNQKLIVFKIKGVDIPPDAVRITTGRSIGLAAPPESHFSIVAEDVVTRSLRFKGNVVGGGRPSTIDVTIDLPEGGWAVRGRHGWTTTQVEPAPSKVWIRAEWQRTEGTEVTPVQAEDAAMVDQLRALGYLE